VPVITGWFSPKYKTLEKPLSTTTKRKTGKNSKKPHPQRDRLQKQLLSKHVVIRVKTRRNTDMICDILNIKALRKCTIESINP